MTIAVCILALMLDRCTICGCQLHRSGEYALPWPLVPVVFVGSVMATIGIVTVVHFSQ
jgi:hypothetical protein